MDVNTGKELHLDGSNKPPYRHPHFSQNRPVQTGLENRLALQDPPPVQPPITLPPLPPNAQAEAEAQVELHRRNAEANREVQIDIR